MPSMGESPRLVPLVQFKAGIFHKTLALAGLDAHGGDMSVYHGGPVTLQCRWSREGEAFSGMSASLRNTSSSPFRLARLTLRLSGLPGPFAGDHDPSRISFLRNGYQSWSTSRSYRLPDRPLKPILNIISLITGNMSNLPANIPGMFSSDMFAVIGDLDTGDCLLAGQCGPFRQFFYVRLHLAGEKSGDGGIEVVYDFGRKVVMPGESLELDGMALITGTAQEIQEKYFTRMKTEMGIKPPKKPVAGWCSWYQYYRAITPDILRKNVETIRAREIPCDVIQIDDGYQLRVGDWLEGRGEFRGAMKSTATYIRARGYRPGLWLAPFIAERGSEILRSFPEFILRNEHGRPMLAGVNFNWPGRLFYALDATNPIFQEHLQKTIRTIVEEWGYTYLKLDFLYAACLRGGQYADFRKSRAEALRAGLTVIRRGAGKDVFLAACGAPLSACVGLVDSMRVGPDTGAFWIKRAAGLLRAGTSTGARDAIRNSMARYATHKKLWLNDPDCVMLRDRDTGLTAAERKSLINAAVITGGVLICSDDMASLGISALSDAATMQRIGNECFRGATVVADIMQNALPGVAYNTAGYICVFNMSGRTVDRRVDLSPLIPARSFPVLLSDAWDGSEYLAGENGTLRIAGMPPHSSRLLRIRNGRGR